MQRASNGYPLFQICHLFCTCILQNARSFRTLTYNKLLLFLQLLNKTVVLSEFFPPQGMLNWKSWMGKQQQLELRSIGLSTKPFSSELTLARPYAMRTAAQPPTSTTSIPDVDSAREDLHDDTHVITFQRKRFNFKYTH